MCTPAPVSPLESCRQILRSIPPLSSILCLCRRVRTSHLDKEEQRRLKHAYQVIALCCVAGHTYHTLLHIHHFVALITPPLHPSLSPLPLPSPLPPPQYTLSALCVKTQSSSIPAQCWSNHCPRLSSTKKS